MPAEGTSKRAKKELAIAYTDKPVSGWGGLIAMVRFFDRVGLREVLAAALPDGRTSPNQIAVVDMVLALFATVLTGGRRFAHVERVRADAVVRGILAVERIASGMTLTRYFGGFVRGQVEQLAEVLWRWMLGRMRRPGPLGAVLDLDSTVFERYGAQEGSLKGLQFSERAVGGAVSRSLLPRRCLMLPRRGQRSSAACGPRRCARLCARPPRPADQAPASHYWEVSTRFRCLVVS